MVLGGAALAAVFLIELARQILAAGRAGRVLGIGVVLRILVRPSFWVIEGLAVAVVFSVVLLMYRK